MTFLTQMNNQVMVHFNVITLFGNKNIQLNKEKNLIENSISFEKTKNYYC